MKNTTKTTLIVVVITVLAVVGGLIVSWGKAQAAEYERHYNDVFSVLESK